MKVRSKSLLVPALVAVVQLTPPLLAQSPTDKPARHSQSEHHARWASLSEDERAKLKAAHQKALTDPEVRAARDRLRQARMEFRDVLRPALLKADPTIQPILEKMRARD